MRSENDGSVNLGRLLVNFAAILLAIAGGILLLLPSWSAHDTLRIVAGVATLVSGILAFAKSLLGCGKSHGPH